VATSQPAETITGARALYDTLRACGVTHLFGLDSPEPLYAPRDLVGTFVYLAGDASSWVTGQVLYVEGGWLL
jgi:NAD(P)-dependent dehydrogenase (short-subunit alcohol dehydrogenase family)